MQMTLHFKLFVYGCQRFIGHQACNREFKQSLDFAVFNNCDTALAVLDCVHGNGYIIIITADCDNVVRIVGNRGCDCARFQRIAFNIADTDMVCAFVTLNAGNFQNIVSTSILSAVPRLRVSNSPPTRPISPSFPSTLKLLGVTLSRWKVSKHFRQALHQLWEQKSP